MIANERSPPHQKRIYISDHELQREFNRAKSDGRNQTEALDFLRETYTDGLSRTGMRLRLFNSAREYQKKWNKYHWADRRRDPVKKAKENAYHAKYRSLRYHADRAIASAFEKVNQNPLSLTDISDLVQKETGIYFRETSMLTLNDRFRENHSGQPIIVPLHGPGFPSQLYALNHHVY